jgi:threonine/homoserine/homoserine lactone efflux protein
MGAFFTVFGISFGLALTGALQPGPLLTYTIQTTLDTRRRGWLTGARVIAGHAALELTLVIALLLVIGLADLLRSETTVRIIGVAGTLFLFFLAFLTLRDVFYKKVDLPGYGGARDAPRGRFLANPYAGGVVISMSNPFWWVWWALTGLGLMSRYDISFANIPLFVGFFAGHELADLGWYSAVSIMAHTGRRWFTRKIYHLILVGTAVLTAVLAVIILIGAFLYRK